MGPQVRGIGLDIGRKRFSRAWVTRLLETMGELGLNTLQLHLSDSTGLGVELPGFEALASPGALSAAEIGQLSSAARACGVRLVPELDTPSHAVALLAGHHEWCLTDRSGAVHPDKVDISNPDATAHIRSLWDATLDLFEPEVVHLGGDEYLAAPWEGEEERRPDRYPVLLDWARAAAGEGAAVEDAYALYITELAAHLRPRVDDIWLWNDHVVPASASPLVPVPNDIALDVWVRWRDWTPSVNDYLDSGYRVLNSNGDLLYFVLSGDGKPNVTGLKSGEDIAETFRPTRFMGLAGERSWLDIDAAEPRFLGAKLTVWCDAADSMSQEETWERLQTWLTPFARTFG